MGMKLIKQVLPSVITLLNLLCGYLAICNVVEGTLVRAAWWIIIAAIFDALDGKVARAAGTSSGFGIELDSLSDLVSFGVAPATLIYYFSFTAAGDFGYVFPFMYLAAGAIRLARFNLKATTGKKKYFTGMPIPSAAGILSSYVLFSENVWSGIASFDIAMGLTILTALAMVSQFHYALMPKISFGTRPDKLRSIWFISHLALVARFPDEMFFPTGILYLISAPFMSITTPAVNYVMSKIEER